LLPIPMTRPNQTPEGFTLDSEGESLPNGLQLVHYRNEEGNREIWLKNYPAKQMARLYQYDRTARANISEDASSVVIVDRYASNATKIAVLLKDKEGQYRQVKTDGIAQKGVELMARIFKLKSTPHIDHLYCNIDTPPEGGSQKLGVVIWGYESGKQELGHWFFDYDIATGKASVDDEKEIRKAGLPLTPISQERRSVSRKPLRP